MHWLYELREEAQLLFQFLLKMWKAGRLRVRQWGLFPRGGSAPQAPKRFRLMIHLGQKPAEMMGKMFTVGTFWHQGGPCKPIRLRG